MFAVISAHFVCQFFFSFLYFNGFHHYDNDNDENHYYYYYCYCYFTLVYLIALHWLSFSLTSAYVCVVLFYFVYPFIGALGLVAGL